MTETKPQSESAPLPLAAPMLLSFVAGYVDSYTYLALFGLFVAQVTVELRHRRRRSRHPRLQRDGKASRHHRLHHRRGADRSADHLARAAGRATLPAMLALEAALLAIFCAMILFGPPIQNATDWHGIVAGLIAASAMGAQSVLVRLLMKGIPQTNVMTGNMTQLGIAITELIIAWRKLADSRHTADDVDNFNNVRGQLLIVSLGRGRFSRRRRRRRDRVRHHRPARRRSRRPHRRGTGDLGADPRARLSSLIVGPLGGLIADIPFMHASHEGQSEPLRAAAGLTLPGVEGITSADPFGGNNGWTPRSDRCRQEAPVHRRRVPGIAQGRPRGLYLRRARQGRHRTPGVPQFGALHRAALRRAA